MMNYLNLKSNENASENSRNIPVTEKFLTYNDGVVENETLFDSREYSDYIEEDDTRLIYTHKINSHSNEVGAKNFATSLDEVNNANIWYENIFKTLTDDATIAYQAEIVFTELFMNAYEHGNLGIGAIVKHNLLEEDIYFETLQKKEEGCTKQIHVKINKLRHQDICYIITQITDDGEGFDTQILSEIFKNIETFNGRGVFVSRKNSFGVYYNTKGNSVLYLNKIERS